MDLWLDVLPIIVYILLITLLIIGIILGIKTIITVSKVEKVVDNVNEKFESLNPLFNILDYATDRIASLSDTVVDLITGLLGKFMTGRGKGKKDE